MKSLCFVCSFSIFLFTVGSDGQPAYASQTPQVHFAKPVAYNSGGNYATSIAIGDVNGDGIPDLVVANCSSTTGTDGAVSVLLGNGDGTFQGAVSYDSGGMCAESVAIGDLNGDGNLDLVVANCAAADGGCTQTNGAVSVLLGNGDGTFQSAMSYSLVGDWARSVAIADLNGDGKPDLIVANECQSFNQYGCAGDGGVSVLLGNGDGTFQAAVTYSSGAFMAQSVAVGDLNGDGIPDLVVANWCSTKTSCGYPVYTQVSVLLGNGDGTFQTAVLYDSFYAANSVAIGDVNGDGIPDLVVANDSVNPAGGGYGGVTILIGNGDGTFKFVGGYDSGGYQADSIAVADVNDDGNLDIIVANECQTVNCNGGYNGDVSVLLGYGNGTFRKAINYGSGGYLAESVAIGDLTADGRLDLVLANSDPNSAGVLLNTTSSYPTKTVLTSSPNPSQINQKVMFTATITSAPSVPNGEVVTFYDAKTNLGTGTMINGVASLTTSFSVAKTYTIKASYPGDAFHKASSGTVKQAVNP
jgi:hypothetical protein